LCYRVRRKALPIHFFRLFFCRIYRLATIAVGCIVLPQHNENPNRRNFGTRNSHGQRGHVTMAIPDAAFSAVRFCSYAVRRTQYDRVHSTIGLLGDSYVSSTPNLDINGHHN